MALKTIRPNSSSGESREPHPPGKYLGRLNLIADLGTQDGGQFGPKQKVIMQWELGKSKGMSRTNQGEPMTIVKFYTASLNVKANWRQDLEKMSGKTFQDGVSPDVESFLGSWCWIQIEHYDGFDRQGKARKRDKVGSLMAVDADDVIPSCNTPTVFFEINVPKCEIPSGVPEWIKKMIEESPEWRGVSPVSTPTTDVDDDSDVPF